MSTDGVALAWQRDIESEHAYPLRFARRRLPDAHAVVKYCLKTIT